jgi:hypothetical protein
MSKKYIIAPGDDPIVNPASINPMDIEATGHEESIMSIQHSR